jgi:hypothetical protein
MKIQNSALALTGSACPGKAADLFYVTHYAAICELSGPYLTEDDAKLSLASMLSAEAVVSRRTVAVLDDRTYRLAVHNGAVVRAFAGADRLGVTHG